MAQVEHGQQAIAPDDLSADDEDEEGDSVGQGAGDDFEGIDFIEVLEAEEGEQG